MIEQIANPLLMSGVIGASVSEPHRSAKSIILATFLYVCTVNTLSYSNSANNEEA